MYAFVFEHLQAAVGFARMISIQQGANKDEKIIGNYIRND